jgi:hypothetical protein
MKPAFDRELRKIISQGDTTKEYRNLFKRIVILHRECFTEENIPTTKDYLEELLADAIEIARLKEEKEFKIAEHQREIDKLKGEL